MTAQHIINSIEFARKALEFHDTMPLLQFSRLAEVLHAGSVNGEAMLDVSLLGRILPENKHQLELFVKGELTLTCQRCLESMLFPLHLHAVMNVVPDEVSLPSEDEEDELEDYIVADDHMDIAQLVEDEVILSLPFAPKHGDDICGHILDQNKELRVNPFDVLKQLKVDKG